MADAGVNQGKVLVIDDEHFFREMLKAPYRMRVKLSLNWVSMFSLWVTRS